MVSSKLHARKISPRKPACTRPCPPPPPPPPPAWPPNNFPLRFVALWSNPYGVHVIDLTFNMDNEGSGWQWVDEIVDGNNWYSATWYADPETHLGLLEISFYHDYENGYANVYDIEIVWSTPTYYQWIDDEFDEREPLPSRMMAELDF